MFLLEKIEFFIAFFTMGQYNFQKIVFFNLKKNMQINIDFANISRSSNFQIYVTNMEPHDSISFLPKAVTNNMMKYKLKFFEIRFIYFLTQLF